MRSELYQRSLILFGVIATAMMGYFFFIEIFPEYKIYQNAYIDLEKFRSTYTHQAPPEFKEGVKQIVIENETHGQPEIDRCISCHIALKFPHFSPTTIAHDINGQILVDSRGHPKLVPNPEYIWTKLDQKIEELTDQKVNGQMASNGENEKVKNRLDYAKKLQELKTTEVDGHVYQMDKVLSMHPLMGRETRPFEYHPIEEYGCTSCHNGNGRGLTTEKAHGPVMDGSYEEAFVGYTPQFNEQDPHNDPLFAKVFNHKPSHDLLFQTTPIFIGALMEAKCAQCHIPTTTELSNSEQNVSFVKDKRERQNSAIKDGFLNEQQALISLILLSQKLEKQGYAQTLESLKQEAKNYTLPEKSREGFESQISFLEGIPKTLSDQEKASQLIKHLQTQIVAIIGSSQLAGDLAKLLESHNEKSKTENVLAQFLEKNRQNEKATGSLFIKAATLDLERNVLEHLKDTQSPFQNLLKDQQAISAISSDVDLLTQHYQRGKELYISQACYACHRIAGFSRGGVGPELTREGLRYPWFVKESMVWPQADLPTSTMPNMRLDHEELEDLMTFLLAQRGEHLAISKVKSDMAIKAWEEGNKTSLETAISPDQIHDLRYSEIVFATEGCASCHRLKGLQSNVGYKVEKGVNSVDFDVLYKEHQWFTNLFPEMAVGSTIVSVIDKYSEEIDQHIVNDVRENSILEEIDQILPDAIISLYSPFRYAMRAKNTYYGQLVNAEKNAEKKAAITQELTQWKDRVKRVLMMFVQEYGLGRLIGPRLNWSGIFRSDEWLMEHFWNPTSHSPRSIMPVFPFDNSKFESLTYMLDTLAKQNRDHLHKTWESIGFSPELAFDIHCSQCHGEYKQGNGPIAEWIYPIPKNLRNADFLRNLTMERVIQSITHGVKGTPMPPWGEVSPDKDLGQVPVLNKVEIEQLARWLFSGLSENEFFEKSNDVLKWNYYPSDLIKEIEKEGNIQQLKDDLEKNIEQKDKTSLQLKHNPLLPALSLLSLKEDYYVSFNPKVYVSTSKDEVNVHDVFDEIPAPEKGPDQYLYYIKKNYFTEKNIKEGEVLFIANCSVCHGKEGAGDGIRAETMIEAKPRMLTNLDWIRTRDDLRLLRSIKYGVPGTAMTPWGDYTSALQRLQLVVYIRELSKEREAREELSTALYQVFNHYIMMITNERVMQSKALLQAKTKYDETVKEHDELYTEVREGKIPSSRAVEAYQQELQMMEIFKKYHAVDQSLIDLISEVKTESDLYRSLGEGFINIKLPISYIEQLIQVIRLNEDRYALVDNRLEKKDSEQQQEEKNIVIQKILNSMNNQITQLEKNISLLKGKILSAEVQKELESTQIMLNSLNKEKNSIISTFSSIQRSLERQQQLYENFELKLTHSLSQK